VYKIATDTCMLPQTHGAGGRNENYREDSAGLSLLLHRLLRAPWEE